MRPSFSSYYQLPEQDVVKALHEGLAWSAAEDHSASRKAAELIVQIRGRKMPAGQLESFLQEYSLSTDEGLALMSLSWRFLSSRKKHC